MAWKHSGRQPNCLDPCHPHGDSEKAPGSWPSRGQCDQLGSRPIYGSTCCSFSLSETQTFKSINFLNKYEDVCTDKPDGVAVHWAPQPSAPLEMTRMHTQACSAPGRILHIATNMLAVSLIQGRRTRPEPLGRLQSLHAAPFIMVVGVEQRGGLEGAVLFSLSLVFTPVLWYHCKSHRGREGGPASTSGKTQNLGSSLPPLDLVRGHGGLTGR